MANEKRLRLLSLTYNGGPINLAASVASATSGDINVVKFNGPFEYADATSASIGGDQYLPIVVDPDSVAAEEMWVISTPSGSPTSASVVRGAGSSTGAPFHLGGASVTSGAMPTDMFHGSALIDTPWGGNLGYDYEFQGDTTSLPSGWAWLNQGNATYSEGWGFGSIYLSTANAGDHLTGIQRSCPAAPFTLTAKCLGGPLGASGNRLGVYLTDSTGLVVSLGSFWHPSTADPALAIDTWDTSQNFVSTPNLTGLKGIPDYLQIVVHSATNIDFNLSYGGSFWMPIQTGYNPGGSLGTPTHFGLFIENNAYTALGEFVWFRVR